MDDTETRNVRKIRTGIVVSLSGEKTVTVKIDYRKHHPKYGKMMTMMCDRDARKQGIGGEIIAYIW